MHQRKSKFDSHGRLQGKVTSGGSTFYYKDGFLHREDGPAIKSFDGSIEYWYDGLLHNHNGYAAKDFYYNSNSGKKDIEYIYAIYGVQYSFDGWLKESWEHMKPEVKKAYVFNNLKPIED